MADHAERAEAMAIRARIVAWVGQVTTMILMGKTIQDPIVSWQYVPKNLFRVRVEFIVMRERYVTEKLIDAMPLNCAIDLHDHARKAVKEIFDEYEAMMKKLGET